MAVKGQVSLPQIGSKYESQNPWSLLHQNKKQGLYLKTLAQLLQNPPDTNTSPFDQSSYYDVLVQLYNYFGEYQKAAEAEEKFMKEISKINGYPRTNKPRLENAPIDSFTMQPALKSIAEVAGNQQVIMINEEHRMSAHRNLTMNLLPILYKKGFRYLALEDINSLQDTALNTRKYPTIFSGSYVHDPVYGELVRQALRIGFTVVGYDFAAQTGMLNNMTDSRPYARDNIRDSMAAHTLINTILKKDPSAKLLVHAGRGHVGKFNLNGAKMMAWYFRAFTGIIPYSIDQVEMSPFNNPLDETLIYRYAQDKYRFTEPVAFKKSANSFWSHAPSGYDMTIFTPAPQYSGEYVNWLLQSSKRKQVPINFLKLGVSLQNNTYSGKEPLTIQAYYLNENASAIPAQQILLLNGLKTKTRFLLLKGNYTVVLKNSEGMIVSSYFMRIT
jgi:hypothetical protein